MSSIEMLRGILVASAVVAALVAMIAGMWLPASVLVVAIGVHGFATPFVRSRARAASPAPPGGQGSSKA